MKRLMLVFLIMIIGCAGVSRKETTTICPERAVKTETLQFPSESGEVNLIMVFVDNSCDGRCDFVELYEHLNTSNGDHVYLFKRGSCEQAEELIRTKRLYAVQKLKGECKL